MNACEQTKLLLSELDCDERCIISAFRAVNEKGRQNLREYAELQLLTHKNKRPIFIGNNMSRKEIAGECKIHGG